MTIKVFSLDDIEYWAGESLEACLQQARAQAGDDCYRRTEDQYEVSPEAMQKLTVRDEDGTSYTFEAWLAKLVADGEQFPCNFAADDW